MNSPIVTLAIIILSSGAAHALDCQKSPDRTPGPFWRYRLIDGAPCWYRSESVVPKSELRWAPDPHPELTMEFGEAPLKPNFVRTVSFKQQPVEKTDASRASELIVIVLGFTLFVAAMIGLAIPRKANQ